MMKKLCCLILLAALLCGMAVAESPSYDVVYTSANPIPDIADRVRPAVVQVVSSCETWDAATRVASVEDVSSGSGCYFRDIEGGKGGYILTNYHIIDGGEVYRIEWLSGEKMDVSLVGYDDGTDIAILQFDEPAPAGVETIPMGDSDKLRIGELVICIGNPGSSTESLLGTVTAGIVSGLEREGINADNFSRSVSVLQTDAAINTGNSGGAMLNAKGELVGIPTLKMMYGSGGYSVYEGLGFCVPINTVSNLIDQIITTGGVVRPRLGITVADIDGPDEPMKKYPPIGVQVYTVEEGGPSDDAGLHVGDVITEIDGVRLEHYTELLREIDKHEAGDVVELRVYRYYDADGNLTGDYEEYTFKVKLEMID
ncbi:MAG: trypsin-like peptidase domain-containing protein [Clostridia bacterium]|nr:trypsin-like peptidase domain-containing protein [Clostridia bacterium]